jgi:hypothetical protein
MDDAAGYIFFLIVIVLFVGEPDLHDALIAWAFP